VTTFGNSCISAAGAGVVLRDLEVTVTPYDQENVTGGCLDFLRPYPRPVSLFFPKAGEATLRVRGRSSDGPGFVTIERRITVTS
jgi:hypothetical protein